MIHQFTSEVKYRSHTRSYTPDSILLRINDANEKLELPLAVKSTGRKKFVTFIRARTNSNRLRFRLALVYRRFPFQFIDMYACRSLAKPNHSFSIATLHFVAIDVDINSLT